MTFSKILLSSYKYCNPVIKIGRLRHNKPYITKLSGVVEPEPRKVSKSLLFGAFTVSIFGTLFGVYVGKALASIVEWSANYINITDDDDDDR